MAKLSVIFTDDPDEEGAYSMKLEFDPPISGKQAVDPSDLSPAQRVGVTFFQAMRERGEDCEIED